MFKRFIFMKRAFLIFLCMLSICVPAYSANGLYEHYYNKAIKELRIADPKLEDALSNIEDALYLFKLRAFFSKPSREKCANLCKHIALIQKIARQIDCCINEVQQELNVIKKNKNDLMISHNDPGIMVLFSILLLPLNIAQDTAEKRKIESHESAIKKMDNAKRYLETTAKKLQMLIAQYC